MFLDVQIHKDWILSVMEGKNSKPFWSLSENGKFRKGNTNDARNYIIDIVSIVGAIVFLLSVNWTLVIYIYLPSMYSIKYKNEQLLTDTDM